MATESAVKFDQRNILGFIVGVVVIAYLSFSILGNARQGLSVTIFVATILGTLMFWRFRLGVAILGITVLLITNTLNIDQMLRFMNVDVIIFLVGTMIIVALLREAHFFEWLNDLILRASDQSARKLWLLNMLLAFIMSAIVGEVASVIFIATMIFSLSEKLEFNPVKFVISAVLVTNIGSAATLLGNPVGILIAFRGSLTFEDFLRWASPVAILGLFAFLPIGLAWSGKELTACQRKLTAPSFMTGNSTLGGVPSTWREKLFLRASVGLFIIFILLVSFHSGLESFLGLARDTMILVSSLLVAGVILVWQRGKAREYVESVEWWTLLFFMFLFAVAGALEFTGVTVRLADAMIQLTGGNILGTISLVIWVAAWGSAFVDNVVLVAAFIPVVHALGSSGTPVFPLWWALLFGGTFGGNITLIGSTANIVALGLLEKHRGIHVRFLDWFKIGLVGGIIPVLVGIVMILLQLQIMPR